MTEDFQRHPTTGAPYVAHPTRITAKGRPARVMYGRPSGLGAQVESRYALEKWAERREIYGASMMDLSGVENLDPDDEADRTVLDGLALEAKKRGGAFIAARRGTVGHELTEYFDRDEQSPVELLRSAEELGMPASVVDALISAYDDCMLRHGLHVLAIEQRVVDDRWRLAGTLDRIVMLERNLSFEGLVLLAGSVVVLDVKGLALDTKLPTPNGWSTIGTIAVGDQVIGMDGRPCTVTAKSELRHRPCYRMVFDDGTAVIADDEHRWVVDSGTWRIERNILTTAEIADTIFEPRRRERAQRQHRIPLVAPVELPAADLPIDPYLFGCWLGDGNRGRGELTKPGDVGMWDEIQRRGHVLGVEQIDKRSGCCTRTVRGLIGDLRRLGVLGDKHIPAVYMRASRTQRLDLLRGLMDSDGTVNTARSGRVTFNNTDKQLSHDVYELVMSLGERAHASETTRTGFGKTVLSYDVEWRPLCFNPFATEPKRSRVSPSESGMNHRRLIVSCDEIDSVPTQCIAVDSPDQTYLCTESWVPTHNTGRLTIEGGRPAYWHSYAVQIASYSHSVPYLIDGLHEERGEWSDPLSQRHGLILHLDIGNALGEGVATAGLYHVDLVAGHMAGNLARAARDWQSRRDVIRCHDEPPVARTVR